MNEAERQHLAFIRAQRNAAFHGRPIPTFEEVNGTAAEAAPAPDTTAASTAKATASKGAKKAAAKDAPTPVEELSIEDVKAELEKLESDVDMRSADADLRAALVEARKGS